MSEDERQMDEFDRMINDELEKEDEEASVQSADENRAGDEESAGNDAFEETKSEVNQEIEYNLNLYREGGAKNTTSVIINLNSLRQRIVDSNNTLKALSIKLKSNINQRRGNEYDRINRDLKNRVRNKDDKYAIVRGRTAELEMKHQMLNNHIEFNVESIKTVDQILYGVKHVMDVAQSFGAVVYRGRK